MNFAGGIPATCTPTLGEGKKKHARSNETSAHPAEMKNIAAARVSAGK